MLCRLRLIQCISSIIIIVFIIIYLFNHSTPNNHIEAIRRGCLLSRSPQHSSFLFSYVRAFSNRLFDAHSILCLVLLRPNASDRESAIVDTWTRRCNRLMFVTAKRQHNRSQYDNSRSVDHEEQSIDGYRRRVSHLIVNIDDGYDRTWEKVRAALHFIDRNYR